MLNIACQSYHSPLRFELPPQHCRKKEESWKANSVASPIEYYPFQLNIDRYARKPYEWTEKQVVNFPLIVSRLTYFLV